MDDACTDLHPKIRMVNANLGLLIIDDKKEQKITLCPFKWLKRSLRRLSHLPSAWHCELLVPLACARPAFQIVQRGSLAL